MPADPVTAASPLTLTVAGRDLDVSDYDGLYAAVMATAQGRWFLEQYASRNRNADTAQVLAAIGRLETEALAPRGTRSPATPAAEPPSPGPDIARVRHGLGEFAAALMRARADIAAIDPPGAMAERPSILSTTEALAEIAWHMRERGIEQGLCDRLDGCAADIRAVCAIPDLTAQRTRAIVDALGDLESRVQAIRASLDDGTSRDDGRDHSAQDHDDHGTPNHVVQDRDVRGDAIHGDEISARNQFDDLRAAANANTPAASIRLETEEEESGDGDIAVFASPRPVEIEPAAAGAPTGHDASAGTEAVSTTAPPSAEAESYEPFDDSQAGSGPTDVPASPRLSHLLIAAELDRLRDAQGAATTDPRTQAVLEFEPTLVEAAPVEAAEAADPVEAALALAAVAADEVTASVEAADPIETTSAPAAAIAPVEVTAPVDAAFRQQASAETPEAAPAPLAPQSPATPTPRQAAEMPKAEIAKVDIAIDLFADVMALSEEERIALFT
jgi:chemotaxis protein CheZ